MAEVTTNFLTDEPDREPVDAQGLLDGLSYPADWYVEDHDSWELYARNTFAGMVVHPFKVIKAPKSCSQHAEYWPPPGESALIEAAPELAREVVALRARVAALEAEVLFLRSERPIARRVAALEEAGDALDTLLDRLAFGSGVDDEDVVFASARWQEVRRA